MKLWEKAPHTEIKHEILRRYLGAWLPILASWQPRLAVIDGFAGPGEYLGEELGSPPIILDTILGHVLFPKFKEVVALFVEQDKCSAEHLNGLLSKRYPAPPKNVKFQVITGRFSETLEDILDDLDSKSKGMAPCFMFVDPFGPAGVPIDLISRFMKHQCSEVLINYPYDPVNRHLAEPAYEDCLDELFGCSDWRKIRSIKDSSERQVALHGLYRDRLIASGVRYSVSFEMRNDKNRVAYFLIYGTKHVKGLATMKSVMWQVDRTGEFSFSDYDYARNQLNPLDLKVDFDQVGDMVLDEFAGKQVSPDAVSQWLTLNTRYCGLHTKKALKSIETRYPDRVLKSRPCYKGTFPDDIRITFK